MPLFTSSIFLSDSLIRWVPTTRYTWCAILTVFILVSWLFWHTNFSVGIVQNEIGRALLGEEDSREVQGSRNLCIVCKRARNTSSITPLVSKILNYAKADQLANFIRGEGRALKSKLTKR